MSGLWVEPIVLADRWLWLAGLFVAFMAWNLAVSRGRRRVMGAARFAVARGVQLAVPLTGLVVVRSGFRQAYIADGRGWWEAMWLSLAWMLGFIIVGQALVRQLPPTAGLLRELRAADQQVWRERLANRFGVR